MATPEQHIANKTNPISKKQAEVLSVIARGNPDGSHVDWHQIRERLSYNPKLDAVRFILRYMIAQRRVEALDLELRQKQDTGIRFKTRVYKVTELGRSFISAL